MALSWETLGGFHYPYDIDFDPNTEFLYVVDNLNDRIVKTKINGDGWETFGSKGSGVNQFDHPYGIDFDPNTESIYVEDSRNGRIVKTKMGGIGWIGWIPTHNYHAIGLRHVTT